MKLSDVRGERTLDVVADLIGPIARIAQDPEASAMFRPEPLPEGMEPAQFFLKRVQESAPALLKGHKDDLIDILSTIKGVSAEEYADGLNLAVLIRDVVELLSDEEFTNFLLSSETPKE